MTNLDRVALAAAVYLAAALIGVVVGELWCARKGGEP